MKYLIWGIGERLKKNIDKLDWDCVIGFVDKKAQNGVTEYYGKPLISAESIKKYSFDGIAISSDKYFDEIAQECIFEWGIDCKRILRLDCLLMEKDSGDPRQQIAYCDVSELILDSNRAGIVRSWLGVKLPKKQHANYIINCRGYIFPVDVEMFSMHIYQVTHKLFHPIGNQGYEPIGVGSETFPYISDNTGDNIAKYNALINECTAIYWIWKHETADYVGLNHYRRVFESEVTTGWPLQDIEALIFLRKYDIIAARAVAFQGYSVATMLSMEICKEAFDVSWRELNRIFDQKSIEEKRAFQTVMEGSIIFPCNMFVAKRARMNEYCEWLFPILFQLIDNVEIKEEWDAYSKRVIGFWAERLFTVWLYYSGYRVKQLPILTIGDARPYGK